MPSFSPGAHMSKYKYAVKIVEDCKDFWLQDYYPNVDQLLYEYDLIDIDGKIQDFMSYYQFKDALDHLINYKFIKVLIDVKSIPRIYEGLREIPPNFTFETYWSRNI
ncbi:MAG: hypothetical protein ACFE8N_12870 [Promethearchaeota archaeon]